MRLISAALLAGAVVHALPSNVEERAAACTPGFPDLPMTVSGRNMLSKSGAKVVYAGVNWPGAADTMLPEGLQYNSAAGIASLIKSLGANVVRLTYAIEMIDDIYDNTADQTLAGTLNNALGTTNGSVVLQQILHNNPSFTAQTTRLQVFDAVASALNAQGIWVHLDNHVSKAEWCCGTSDGNAWWGDTYFDPYKWVRGLGYMANHIKSWPNAASMSLRNELRYASSGQPVTWNTWMNNVIPAANAIHGNNSNVLIFFSGQNFDTDDTYFVQKQTWNGATFTPSSYSFANKIVYELHNYENGATSCSGDIAPNIYNAAYCAMNLTDTSCPNHGPVVMTEFGFNNEDSSYQSVYAQCIKSTLLGQPGGPGGFMQWVIAGSYYIRSGTQDMDETWGLLNHNWSGWRQTAVAQSFLKPFITAAKANCGNGS